jgi:hypothetical protein
MRYRELIDLAWAIRVKQDKAESNPPKSMSQLKEGFFAYIDQAIARTPWTAHNMRTLTQSSLIYSYEGEGVLRPWQHMCLQGHARNLNLVRLSDAEVKSIAGEGFACPCIGLVTYCVFLEPAAPWWRRPDSARA